MQRCFDILFSVTEKMHTVYAFGHFKNHLSEKLWNIPKRTQEKLKTLAASGERSWKTRISGMPCALFILNEVNIFLIQRDNINKNKRRGYTTVIKTIFK